MDPRKWRERLMSTSKGSCIVLDRREYGRRIRKAFFIGMGIAFYLGLCAGYAWRMGAGG
jgi:hypothetical protein